MSENPKINVGVVEIANDKFELTVKINDRGEIWYYPPDGESPQLLADAESLCGAFIFKTDDRDLFRDCCTVHDNFYENRAFFEARGWNRKMMDDYFLHLMRQRAGGDPLRFAKAVAYYNLVRCVGWVLYYRHPGYEPGVPIDSIIPTMYAAPVPEVKGMIV